MHVKRRVRPSKIVDGKRQYFDNYCELISLDYTANDDNNQKTNNYNLNNLNKHAKFIKFYIQYKIKSLLGQNRRKSSKASFDIPVPVEVFHYIVNVTGEFKQAKEKRRYVHVVLF